MAKWRSERGETLIEFAFASVLFLTIVFGTIMYGIAIWRYNLLSDLAQEGVRRAAVCGSKSGLTSSDCNIQTYLDGRAIGLTITVTTTPSTISTLLAGSTVQVQVQNTFTPFTSLVPGGTLTLSSTAQMVVAR